MPLLRYAPLAALLSLNVLIPSTLAWGYLGHRTVAYLASQYLTPDASDYSADLLNSQDISEASLWADKIRYVSNFTYTAGWHYINAEDDPPRKCGVLLKRDCDTDDSCIVAAIANQTQRLTRNNVSQVEKGQALKFLLHFIGDIHQPLHTEAEGRGGNDIEVLFGEEQTNLHSVWDSDIPDKRAGGKDDDDKAAALAWAKMLYAADEDHNASLVAECQDLAKAERCALEWADEANQWVCDYVLKDDVAGVEGKNLSGDYYEGAVPIVDLLIGKAGRRLGAWMNALALNDSRADLEGLDVEARTEGTSATVEEL